MAKAKVFWNPANIAYHNYAGPKHRLTLALAACDFELAQALLPVVAQKWEDYLQACRAEWEAEANG